MWERGDNHGKQDLSLAEGSLAERIILTQVVLSLPTLIKCFIDRKLSAFTQYHREQRPVGVPAPGGSSLVAGRTMRGHISSDTIAICRPDCAPAQPWSRTKPECPQGPHVTAETSSLEDKSPEPQKIKYDLDRHYQRKDICTANWPPHPQLPIPSKGGCSGAGRSWPRWGRQGSG